MEDNKKVNKTEPKDDTAGHESLNEQTLKDVVGGLSKKNPAVIDAAETTSCISQL
jgi:hypothetical protein